MHLFGNAYIRKLGFAYHLIVNIKVRKFNLISRQLFWGHLSYKIRFLLTNLVLAQHCKLHKDCTYNCFSFSTTIRGQFYFSIKCNKWKIINVRDCPLPRYRVNQAKAQENSLYFWKVHWCPQKIKYQLFSSTYEITLFRPGMHSKIVHGNRSIAIALHFAYGSEIPPIQRCQPLCWSLELSTEVGLPIK